MHQPGELVHVDIKKLGRIPKGGGWRVHGRTARPSTHRTRKARHRIRVRALRDRRLLTSGLQRSPRQRARTHRRRLHAPSTRVLRRTTTSVSNASSPTTGPATEAAPSRAPWATSHIRSRSATDRKPTAKLNASTAPCSPNGPTPDHGPQTDNEPADLPTGSTPTTITDTTPPSTAHPSAASNVPGQYS